MIQSAEEFITEIADDRTGILADKIERGRSRDKAIIERCKEAISKYRPKQGADNNGTIHWQYSAALDNAESALDSVLRELSE